MLLFMIGERQFSIVVKNMDSAVISTSIKILALALSATVGKKFVFSGP